MAALPFPFLRENVSLAPFTTWRIGGPARFLAEPPAEALPGLLAWARAGGLPVWILGRGSNVLIDDDGLPGLIILTRNIWQDIRREGDCLVAGAGASLPRLSKAAAAEGFSGYEFYIGIPGTVGGAVFMNAGFGPGDPRDTRAVLVDVELVRPDGDSVRAAVADLHMDYRHSILQDADGPFADAIVTRARFRLEHPGDAASIRDETREHLADRKRKQPLTRPTAGSVFRASDGVPAAIHIDRAGLKGFRIGDACVSPKHANWIENLGKASAADVRALIRHVRETVHAIFGVTLEPEVREMGG
ncbi:MAG: UDP-N-acetylmuramate dehydrogenase [Opitutales bacterium]|nr:UDP-N-acetylmuramate dehydrogenase [Opitutales bacterium]